VQNFFKKKAETLQYIRFALLDVTGVLLFLGHSQATGIVL
jgi:hypothetical protein